MKKRLIKMSLGLIQHLLAAYSWLLFKTCKFDVKVSHPTLTLLRNCGSNDMSSKAKHKTIFCSNWHGRIAVFPKLYADLGIKINAVSSNHSDGQLIIKLLNHYGHQAIKGSSRKGAFSAMKDLLAAIPKGGVIALTPDGPKGPRHEIKGAILTLSKKYQLPIIYVCFSATKAILLNSWDRFMIPLPFVSKIYIEISDPIVLDDTISDPKQYLEELMVNQLKRLDKIAGVTEVI